MSVDWTTLQAGVSALWQTLMGLTDVRWADTARNGDGVTPAGFVAAGTAFATADIQVTSNVGVGVQDALTWDEASPNGPMVQTTRGVRELTLRTKVTVYDQHPDRVARVYLERLRDRLPWDSARDALAALGLGVIEARALLDLSKKADQRITSIAAMDVRFTLCTSDTDPTEYSRIETVEDVTIQEPPP